jgi:hypothetical protein
MREVGKGFTGPLKIWVVEPHDRFSEENATGLVTISVLRVCKQFYVEYKDSLWTENKFVFRGEELSWMIFKRERLPVDARPISPFLRLRDLEVHTEFFKGNVGTILKELGRIAPRTSFRSLTVIVNRSDSIVFSSLRTGTWASRYVSEDLHLFYDGTSINAPGPKPRNSQTIIDPRVHLRTLERKIVLTRRTKDYLVKTYHDRISFEKLVEKVHIAFGGEFWIEDKLCWKNGVKVAHTLE